MPSWLILLHKCGKGDVFDSWSSVYPMSCQLHDSGCTEDKLSNSSLFPGTVPYIWYLVYLWPKEEWLTVRLQWTELDSTDRTRRRTTSTCVPCHVAIYPDQISLGSDTKFISSGREDKGIPRGVEVLFSHSILVWSGQLLLHKGASIYDVWKADFVPFVCFLGTHLPPTHCGRHIWKPPKDNG